MNAQAMVSLRSISFRYQCRPYSQTCASHLNLIPFNHLVVQIVGIGSDNRGGKENRQRTPRCKVAMKTLLHNAAVQPV